MSEGAPMGEWVDKAAPVAQKPGTEAPGSSGTWLSSSELFDGADVTEDPDALADDVFEELLARKRDATKKPGQ